jgi:hypothetical protein
MNWTSSLLGLQFASSGLCAAISVLAPAYLAGFRLPMQFHSFLTLQWSFQADTAPSKVPSGDPEQWAPEASDDAASAASTTRPGDITSLLLGLLFGPWSTRRRRTSRRTGSLYRHTVFRLLPL